MDLESVSKDSGSKAQSHMPIWQFTRVNRNRQFLKTARKVEKVLSGLTLFKSDQLVDFIVDKAQINTLNKNAEKPNKTIS